MAESGSAADGLPSSGPGPQRERGGSAGYPGPAGSALGDRADWEDLYDADPSGGLRDQLSADELRWLRAPEEEPDGPDPQLYPDAYPELDQPAAPAAGGRARVLVSALKPGSMLAGLLEQCAPDRLEDGPLVESLPAWRRIASWAAAGEVAAIAELARRRVPRLWDHADEPDDALGVGAEPVAVCREVIEEIALALTLTHWSADSQTHLAVSLARRLPATLAALSAGRIDLPRARLFDDATVVLSDEDAQRVEARVLPRASRMTTGELRDALRRAVIKIDPAAAEKRRRRAERHARVRLYGDSDHTATLAGEKLPAASAAAAYARIAAIAAAMKAAGLPGSTELLQSQVFAGLLLGTLPHIPPAPPGPDDAGPGDSGPDGSGFEENGPQGSGPPDSGADRLGPEGSNPPDSGAEGSSPDGFGPPDSGPDGSRPDGFGPRGSGPDGGREATDPIMTGPGGGESREPGSHDGDPDSGEPHSSGPHDGGPDDACPKDPGGGASPGAGPGDSGRPAGKFPRHGGLASSGSDAAGHGGPPRAGSPPTVRPEDQPSGRPASISRNWPVLPVPGQAAAAGCADVPAAFRSPVGRLQLTVPWRTLAGLAPEPGRLCWLGPVTPQTAREIAAAGAADPACVWKVIITDDEGQALAVTRLRRRQVASAARSRTWFPGLGQPARQRGSPLKPRSRGHPELASGQPGLVKTVTLTLPYAMIGAFSDDVQARIRLMMRTAGSSHVTGAESLEVVLIAAINSAAAKIATDETALAGRPPPGTAGGTAGGQSGAGSEICAHTDEVPGYRVPRRMRAFLQARDVTCRFPVCRQPAWHSDADHTIPYDQGGRTCRCNLGHTCRTHHQLKQLPGWTLEQPSPGVFLWRTPSGISYVVTPDRHPA